MRALMLDGEPRVVEVPVPKPAQGEALIQVLAAGICNTDVELTRGYMGFKSRRRTINSSANVWWARSTVSATPANSASSKCRTTASTAPSSAS